MKDVIALFAGIIGGGLGAMAGMGWGTSLTLAIAVAVVAWLALHLRRQ